MDLPEISRLVAEWASAKPLVGRVHVFGSRARGDHRPDSDVDIAIVLDMSHAQGFDESGGFATWAFDTEDWKEELEALLGLKVDLQRNGGDETPNVQRGLQRSSLLVYDKKGQSLR